VGVTERLAELFESARKIAFNNSSRLILFSDCHRGDNSWAEARKQPLVSGHTHNPSFPVPQGPPYFNTGSRIHPRCITGIEIENGEILLIKWWVKTKEDGSLFVGKDRLVEESWRLGSSSAL
jgi:hypothetical protein